MLEMNAKAWFKVPGAPPLCALVLQVSADKCQECGLPRYVCRSEAGQVLTVCASMLRQP